MWVKMINKNVMWNVIYPFLTRPRNGWVASHRVRYSSRRQMASGSFAIPVCSYRVSVDYRRKQFDHKFRKNITLVFASRRLTVVRVSDMRQ